ncbi:gamma-butyrobetaine hydroxylase-like domain-containing protein [Chthonobacter albigriseus]|uniref:gamma-butyrobetaine hydroxylase-like domain-containing protein n=1 Tax=Chthonobacter albigriseus TaxID=1683161 RepID=UPI0015EE7C35|nr:DUF971 domain-containing protein [Chthonobacter albigriseus]
MSTTTAPWPTEVRLKADKKTLTVAFDDGRSFDIPAELLRVRSPSAEVQGHGAGQRRTIGGKRNVQILGVEPVGSYAVRLRFDDMHDTGIFPWGLLREMGERRDAFFEEYVAELAEKGLSR